MVVMSVQAAPELYFNLQGNMDSSRESGGNKSVKGGARSSRPLNSEWPVRSDGVIDHLEKRQFSECSGAAINVQRHGVNRVQAFFRPGRIEGEINEIQDAARLRPPVKSLGIAVHAHI